MKNALQVFAFVAAEYETPKNSLNQVCYSPHFASMQSLLETSCGFDLTFLLQVSLWDAIIPDKEHAKFRIQTSNKYRFIDQVQYIQ